MDATASLLTAADLWNLPDDGCRYDLIRGKLLKMPPAGGRHGRIVGDLIYYLGTWVRGESVGRFYAGNVGIVLARDPDVVIGPDLVFVCNDNLPDEVEERGFLERVPDLIIEVLSPADISKELIAKLHECLQAGVPLIWLIDPQDRMVTVYEPEKPPHTLTRDDELTGGDVLPGFTLPLSTLFQEPGA